MKRYQFCVGSLPLLAAFALSGCQRNSGDSAAGGRSVEIGPKYSARDGLFVPDDTRLSLGLKIVDVTEQIVPSTLNIQLCVYRNSGENLLASASVTLEEAKALKRGQVVRVTANGARFTGQVMQVNDAWLRATGTVEILVEIRDQPGAFAVGAFLPASVELDSTASVVTIPRAALLECSDGHSVYTVSGESFVRALVTVGVINSDLVEIKDGLYAGDQVVLRPVMSLWLTELAAVKGGQACCVVPARGN